MGTTTTRGAGRCRKMSEALKSFFWAANGVGRGGWSVSQKGQDKNPCEKDIKALSRPLHEYEYPIRPICFVPYTSECILHIFDLTKCCCRWNLKNAQAYDTLCANPYCSTSPDQLCQEKRRPDQDICSFSVISSWNARVPAGYSGLRLQQLKLPPIAQVCGWVMFWRASWMDQ